MAIFQSNMGEEIINGVSEVLKELYGADDCVHVVFRDIGVVLVVIVMVLDEWTWRVGDQREVN